jgi:hypothetical protein
MSDYVDLLFDGFKASILQQYAEIGEGKIAYSFVRKFGRNVDIDLGSAETVWDGGGIFTFPSIATPLALVSSSTDDVGGSPAGTGAQVAEIQGLDANYLEISELIALNGTTPVVTVLSYLRLHRVIIRQAGSGGQNAGTITVTQSGPSPALVLSILSVGSNKSQLGYYTVPAGKTAFLLGVLAGAQKGTAAQVDIDLLIRPFGEVFQVRGVYGVSSAGPSSWVSYQVPLQVAAQSDIRFDAVSSAVNTQVSIEFPLILIDD